MIDREKVELEEKLNKLKELVMELLPSNNLPTQNTNFQKTLKNLKILIKRDDDEEQKKIMMEFIKKYEKTGKFANNLLENDNMQILKILECLYIRILNN